MLIPPRMHTCACMHSKLWTPPWLKCVYYTFEIVQTIRSKMGMKTWLTLWDLRPLCRTICTRNEAAPLINQHFQLVTRVIGNTICCVTVMVCVNAGFVEAVVSNLGQGGSLLEKHCGGESGERENQFQFPLHVLDIHMYTCVATVYVDQHVNKPMDHILVSTVSFFKFPLKIKMTEKSADVCRLPMWCTVCICDAKSFHWSGTMLA